MSDIPQYLIDNAFLKLPKATEFSVDYMDVPIMKDPVVQILSTSGEFKPVKETAEFYKITFKKQKMRSGNFRYVHE
jgi:hypothetical protein